MLIHLLTITHQHQSTASYTQGIEASYQIITEHNIPVNTVYLNIQPLHQYDNFLKTDANRLHQEKRDESLFHV